MSDATEELRDRIVQAAIAFEAAKKPLDATKTLNNVVLLVREYNIARKAEREAYHSRSTTVKAITLGEASLGITRDILLLAGYDVPVLVLQAKGLLAVQAAEHWASREHMAGMHRILERKPMPKWLDAFSVKVVTNKQTGRSQWLPRYPKRREAAIEAARKKWSL